MTHESGGILVIEDEKFIAELLVLYLTQAGYHAWYVPDGPAALAAVAEHRPALILLDLMLPGMDGADVLAALRRAGALAPVIITSVLEPSAAQRLLGDAAVRYLPKHHGLAALLACIQEQIGPPEA
jgi:DNA-binding response OmpR family regulator